LSSGMIAWIIHIRPLRVDFLTVSEYTSSGRIASRAWPL